MFPRTPACYGFSIIAKVRAGREETVRAYGRTMEETIAWLSELLDKAPSAADAVATLGTTTPRTLWNTSTFSNLHGPNRSPKSPPPNRLARLAVLPAASS